MTLAKIGLLSVSILLLSTSCAFAVVLNNKRGQSIEPTRDWFFDPYFRGDPNLPLIRPYHAEYFDGSEEWFIGFQSPQLGFSGANSVKDVDIKQNVVFVHCVSSRKHIVLYGNPVSQAWYVIQLDKQIEIGFGTLEEFEKYLVDEGIEAPEWRDIQGAWENFNSTGDLPWK